MAKYWAIRFAHGDLGRPSTNERAIRDAYALIEEHLRERCEVVCLVDVAALTSSYCGESVEEVLQRIERETLHPSPPDPFSQSEIDRTVGRAEMPTLDEEVRR